MCVDINYIRYVLCFNHAWDDWLRRLIFFWDGLKPPLADEGSSGTPFVEVDMPVIDQTLLRWAMELSIANGGYILYLFPIIIDNPMGLLN